MAEVVNILFVSLNGTAGKVQALDRTDPATTFAVRLVIVGVALL
jgi:hypothetical protein